ncbi:MAG: sensor histidine kinase [Phycisphaerales bacterium]
MATLTAENAPRDAPDHPGGFPAPNDTSRRLFAASRRIAIGLALLSIAVGLSSLIGHWTHTERLFRWRPELGQVVPNTALLLILCGSSVLLHVLGRFRGPLYWAGIACGIAAGLDCTIVALEYILELDLLVDDLLLPASYVVRDPPDDLRPGSGALICLCLCSGTCVLLHTRHFSALVLSTFCTSLCMVTTTAVAMGYGFDVAEDSTFWGFLDMSLATCLATACTSVASVFARPDRPAAMAILSRHAGGSIARRLLPLCVGLPAGLAALYASGLQLRFVDQPAGLAILTALIIAVFAVVVQVTASALNRTDRLRSDAEAHRTRMLHELDHRVKNNLAAVLGLFDQTSGGVRAVEELRAAFRSRLVAMAKAHEALAANRWENAALLDVLSSVLSPFAAEGSGTVSLDGPTVLLPAAAVLPVAVTINELATNAVKHGALRDTAGETPAGLPRIRIHWQVDSEDRLCLSWNELPGSPPPDRPRGGYGTTLIRGIIAHELGGSADLRIDERGVACDLVVPLRLRAGGSRCGQSSNPITSWGRTGAGDFDHSPISS